MIVCKVKRGNLEQNLVLRACCSSGSELCWFKRSTYALSLPADANSLLPYSRRTGKKYPSSRSIGGWGNLERSGFDASWTYTLHRSYLNKLPEYRRLPEAALFVT